MAKRISILGSTGSIGQSTLSVLRRHPDAFELVGISAGDNVELLAKQVEEFRPTIVSTKTEEGAKALHALLPKTQTTIVWGEEGACKVAQSQNAQVVVSAIVGAAGLKPTVAAIEAGKDIALANKESLVVAGAWMMNLAKKHGVRIFPVDSEHSAIFQSLGNAPTQGIRRLILTASGGPFFRKKDLDLHTVTKAQALAHPNWSMGEKITIDSATMMNKGLEVIEAKWLFDLPISQVDVVVHPQSIIHSMVEFWDGSIISQMGVPDMAAPIAYAISYPDRLKNIAPCVDFSTSSTLEFFEPDHERFPCINLARHAVEMGPTHPAALNGANEVTVKAFLDERIRFTQIASINEQVLLAFHERGCEELADFVAADAWGRAKALTIIQD
ncbi:MAG: 1-deoxy-D-xylulose-5-phosphate reductoisomerase [Bdellovibrionota bacterium]